MMRKALAAATGFALLGAASVAVGAPQGAAENAPTYMNAVVVSTDVAASTVTVRPKGNAPQTPQTLRVEYALATRLGQLKPGDQVIVTLRAGRLVDIRLSSGRPGPMISPTPGPTPTPTPNPWRTPPPVPTPRPVPTPTRVFPSPELTVPPSPGPSPTPTPSPS